MLTPPHLVHVGGPLHQRSQLVNSIRHLVDPALDSPLSAMYFWRKANPDGNLYPLRVRAGN
jgi:hypothetical protein